MFTKKLANCSKQKVVETNCGKNMEEVVNCSKGKVVETNCSKNMAQCSKRKEGKTNCSKRKEGRTNCSKNMEEVANCSKNKEGVANCSKEKVVDTNCSKNKEVNPKSRSKEAYYSNKLVLFLLQNKKKVKRNWYWRRDLVQQCVQERGGSGAGAGLFLKKSLKECCKNVVGGVL